MRALLMCLVPSLALAGEVVPQAVPVFPQAVVPQAVPQSIPHTVYENQEYTVRVPEVTWREETRTRQVPHTVLETVPQVCSGPSCVAAPAPVAPVANVGCVGGNCRLFGKLRSRGGFRLFRRGR